ncbi:MAG TPA: LamG-like jellyroll fold domain-containing protein [Kofleriaceae bacterium]|nr:LamG-like jellyroll fold domain-containing protein [Kofleriaceae bacterium]
MFARFACLLLAGCGRIAFDPLSGGGAPGDTQTGDAFGGPAGSAVSLNGTGYVSLDSLCPLLVSGFTIDGWFRLGATTQIDSDTVAPIGLNSNDMVTNYTLVLWDWRDGSLAYYDDVYTMRTQNPAAVPGDEWHFFSLTYVPGRAIVYADGTSFSDAQTPQTVTSPCHVSLGQELDITGPSDFMVGLIDEVSVWSVAQSPSEILATMQANVTGSEPNLVGYYRFDGNGADSSGHNRTANLVAATFVAVP